MKKTISGMIVLLATVSAHASNNIEITGSGSAQINWTSFAKDSETNSLLKANLQTLKDALDRKEVEVSSTRFYDDVRGTFSMITPSAAFTRSSTVPFSRNVLLQGDVFADDDCTLHLAASADNVAAEIAACIDQTRAAVLR